MPAELTPIERFGTWWAKREDTACFSSLEYPSGSKVRQYERMMKNCPGAPVLVGCGSFSCQQIYTAAAGRIAGVPSYVVTAERKVKTDASLYCERLGCSMTYVRPGYQSVVRARAKELGRKLGGVVRWDVHHALQDAALQVENLPQEVLRVVVPTGSGLTAAGIMGGLAERNLSRMQVVAVCVSRMAKAERIIGAAKTLSFKGLPALTMILHPMAYSSYVVARLPDGTPLDPFYSAKSMAYVQDGDCLWLPGLRPVCSMPERCQEEFHDWRGFA